MSSPGIAVHAGHGPVAWPPDAQYGAASAGKIGMWVFLVSDAFSFGGLLIAYGILHAGERVWHRPGEPALGILFTAFLTFLLLCSSLTNVLAYSAAMEGDRRRTVRLLAVTALLGVLFLVGQGQEWFGIVGHGLMTEGLVFGHSKRASTFYAITGFHGLHVLAGVVYILVIMSAYARGRVHAAAVELLSLFWCFVDFVWIFVFSFIYLLG